ncbi:SDR family oxidoreductase [Bacterioplanoides sp. SCSIO 12839]|uniref:SDR family oxidoreductase n=1 Tax=Bacterioplanoides sp. SCSIO 12839 TaxID=2829569 RepID=UPI002107F4BD|nr:SDR family oxidoreductase [Bacterioplanoides sp. SCSIO 12839]UTW49289.1 SDR family oxidoreductase [Bacterioplanoides sp. SCSIO 12839]
MANVVITGANRGIGLELAKLYAARGDLVTAICREAGDEIEDIADQTISGIDVTNEQVPEGLQTILAELVEGKIDVLINNAGIFQNETLDNMDADSIRQQFEVNTIAPLMIAHALLPLMGEGSKIANITSRMGSLEDNTSGAYYGYRASKAALNAVGKSLAMDLKPRGIAVAQLHPGFVQTRMVGFNGDITPEQAAEGLAQRIDELSLENTGGFWHSNGQQLPW